MKDKKRMSQKERKEEGFILIKLTPFQFFCLCICCPVLFFLKEEKK